MTSSKGRGQNFGDETSDEGLSKMVINMKALWKHLTPVTPAQAEKAMAASLTAHAEKYGPPSKTSVCLESPNKAVDELDGESADVSSSSPE
ncbi:hypothetical protein [Paraburkholderia acidisoli]|uniref:Uncharacterized protein n=1 Tax=Paraburkholderia acidisoli TaxID=2571748 RepID=A0A7Z2GIF9_9BURK|nr:hypothetical protein [Paraburkholderia acidisoli]QGZ62387.1 hypothetical protein FAZ98_11985 [Paraburkholderia acidisoli]